jgi:hypothetical protein
MKIAEIHYVTRAHYLGYDLKMARFHNINGIERSYQNYLITIIIITKFYFFFQIFQI